MKNHENKNDWSIVNWLAPRIQGEKKLKIVGFQQNTN